MKRNYRRLFVGMIAAAVVISASPITEIAEPLVAEAAKKVSINKKKVTLGTGDVLDLSLKNNTKHIKWSSSKKSVASVNSKGSVTARKSGKATITAKVGKKKFNCLVTVRTAKLNYSKATLALGSSLKLKVENATNPCKWASSKKSIASVNNAGLVTANKPGKAKITARINKKKFSCAIEVSKAPYLNKMSLELLLGESFQLELKGASGNIKWNTSDSSVAKVSNTGKVTVTGDGDADVIATYNGKKYKCELEVPCPDIDADDYEVGLGRSLQLRLLDCKLPPVWSCSDSSIASITPSGLLTGLKEGTVTVYAKAGACTYEMDFDVVDDIIYLLLGETYEVDALGNVTNSNPNVVQVENGVITAIGYGEAVVTVDDGEYIEEYYFQVVPEIPDTE